MLDSGSAGRRLAEVGGQLSGRVPLLSRGWNLKAKLNPRQLSDALNNYHISATTKAPHARLHSPLARGDFAVPPDAYRDSASYPRLHPLHVAFHAEGGEERRKSASGIQS